MNFISVIYIQKRNFWCMTMGGTQQKIFHLQKEDEQQSGSQNWRKTSKCLEKKYIHLNYIYKGAVLEGIQVEFWFFVFFESIYDGVFYNWSPAHSKYVELDAGWESNTPRDHNTNSISSLLNLLPIKIIFWKFKSNEHYIMSF